MNWKRTAHWSWLILPFLLLALWPGIAAAKDPRGVPAGTDGVLYELWENVFPPEGGILARVSAISGSVKIDSPVCAGAAPFLGPEAGTCEVTAMGTNFVNLVTGVVNASGEFKVVIEPTFLPLNPFDGPEFVVGAGRFDGTVTVAALPPGTPHGIAKRLPDFPVLLDLEGNITVFGVGGFPFRGRFRLPFAFDHRGEMIKPRPGHPAFYLSDTGRLVGVREDELVRGVSVPRFELTMGP